MNTSWKDKIVPPSTKPLDADDIYNIVLPMGKISELFVSFFGEEYRDLILQKFDSILPILYADSTNFKMNDILDHLSISIEQDFLSSAHVSLSAFDFNSDKQVVDVIINIKKYLDTDNYEALSKNKNQINGLGFKVEDLYFVDNGKLHINERDKNALQAITYNLINLWDKKFKDKYQDLKNRITVTKSLYYHQSKLKDEAPSSTYFKDYYCYIKLSNLLRNLNNEVEFDYEDLPYFKDKFLKFLDSETSIYSLSSYDELLYQLKEGVGIEFNSAIDFKNSVVANQIESARIDYIKNKKEWEARYKTMADFEKNGFLMNLAGSLFDNISTLDVAQIFEKLKAEMTDYQTRTSSSATIVNGISNISVFKLDKNLGDRAIIKEFLRVMFTKIYNENTLDATVECGFGAKHLAFNECAIEYLCNKICQKLKDNNRVIFYDDYQNKNTQYSSTTHLLKGLFDDYFEELKYSQITTPYSFYRILGEECFEEASRFATKFSENEKLNKNDTAFTEIKEKLKQKYNVTIKNDADVYYYKDYIDCLKLSANAEEYYNLIKHISNVTQKAIKQKAMNY